MERVGRYQLLREVARGGMGVVHRARTPDGQTVALKLLLAGATATPLLRHRMATEVQTLLRLRHPNVVALLDAGQHSGVPYLVMEWVEGESLAARLARDGPLDPRAAVELVRRLGHALEYCHERGVLHRDLKPDNVLIRAADGQPLLVDFGISKDVLGDQPTTILKTIAGRWLGSPGWWPPEQALGKLELLGPRSDVYGLGALLHGALTGTPPQEGKTIQELILALDRPPTSPSARRPGLPAWLDAVCLRALAPDPAQRHASAQELARTLEAGGEPEPSRHAAREGSGRGLVLASALSLLGGAAAAAVLFGEPGDRLLPSTTSPETSADRVRAQEVTERVAEATRAWRANQHARALELTNGLLAESADPPAAAHLIQAMTLRLRGDPCSFSAARRAKALSLDPGERALAAGLADTAPDLGQLEEAAALRPGDPDPWFWMAYLRGDDHLGAIEDCTRAIAIDPGHVNALVLRSQARYLRGDQAGAVDDCTRAIAIDPHNAQPLVCRGVARRALGDNAGAIEDYTRAIAIDPKQSDAFNNRGNALREQGDLVGAIDDYTRAMTIKPRSDSLFGRALARHEQGDAAGEIEDYTRAIAIDPRNAAAIWNRGIARSQLGKLSEAIADFEWAEGLYPAGSSEATELRKEIYRLREYEASLPRSGR